MRLHNLVVFYAYILTPIVIMMSLTMLQLIDSRTFTIAILGYALVYHPWISGLRLVALAVITPSKLIYNFIPFWNTRYFDYLFIDGTKKA
jgi:hypothetical protein